MLRENPLERVYSKDIIEEIQLLTKPYCRELQSKKKLYFKIFYRFYRFRWNHRLKFIIILLLLLLLIILFYFTVFYLNFVSKILRLINNKLTD